MANYKVLSSSITLPGGSALEGEIVTAERLGDMRDLHLKRGAIEESEGPQELESKKAGIVGKGKVSADELPEDFPARDKLIEGGFDTLEKVQDASDEELLEIKGVGEATVTSIRAYEG
jgi:hypothetical protein